MPPPRGSQGARFEPARLAHPRRARAPRGPRRMRIAMLTYSVKPRGGVVHALEVSEALARRGHEVELMALARPGEELFRAPRGIALRVVRFSPPDDVGFDERIQAMLAAYTDGLRPLL